MQFATCSRCRHPFPVFVEGTSEARCPPCRKRALGESLTKSDLAFEEVHAFYEVRETGWRNRLDILTEEVEDLRALKSRRRTDDNSTIESLERTVERLRDENQSLEGRIEAMTATAERREAEAELTRRALRDWKKEVETSKRENDMLRAEIRNLHARLQATEFMNLFRPQQPPALDPKFVDELIKLCHPDRHNNSPASNSATATLLGMRKR